MRCLHLCFHGQWLQWQHYKWCKMSSSRKTHSIRDAITEKPTLVNILKNKHGNITKTVSVTMFSWSMITMARLLELENLLFLQKPLN